MTRILITSALPYANGPLHFGHLAGAYLPADIYARFERLQGNEVLFISGSDEYGVAITLSADLQKRVPQEHVDIFHEQHKELFGKLHIDFDYFSRTTDWHHAPLVHAFFSDLLKNGHLSLEETEQLYSEEEKRFLADRYVEGTCPRCQYEKARGDECGKCGASFEATDLLNPRSKLSQQPLVVRKTTHYFLHFEHFKSQLAHFLQARPWRANVVRFVESYLKDLRQRAITRDLAWGVPLPAHAIDTAVAGDHPPKVFYVWFDAPIGYISATQAWAQAQGRPEAWKEYWLDGHTKYVQFVGKDNIPFHALFFPAMIFGQNTPYKLVDELVAAEFYNLQGRQFSKSEGWTIDVEDVLTRYTADQIRYVLASTAPETADADFTWKEFQNRCNAELLGKFGNLVHRVLVFAENHTDAKIPSRHELEAVDLRFIDQIYSLMEQIKASYADFRVRRVTQLLMEMATLGNGYFDAKAPWRCRNEAMQPVLETTIHLCIEMLRLLALASYPILPQTAQKIWTLLGQEGQIGEQKWEELLKRPLQQAPLIKPSPLFMKIEDEMIDREMAILEPLLKQNGTQEASEKRESVPIKPLCTLEDFHKLDLRVGQVLEAEKVAKSKKLLRLRVDVGHEIRTIVSGIADHYTVESIVGVKVVVIANLAPAKIMGIESQGMILAASLASHLELISLDDMPVGACIS